MSKGADESAKSIDDEVAKDRLEVFKRREQLRKKRNAMRFKILARFGIAGVPTENSTISLVDFRWHVPVEDKATKYI